MKRSPARLFKLKVSERGYEIGCSWDDKQLIFEISSEDKMLNHYYSVDVLSFLFGPIKTITTESETIPVKLFYAGQEHEGELVLKMCCDYRFRFAQQYSIAEFHFPEGIGSGEKFFSMKIVAPEMLTPGAALLNLKATIQEIHQQKTQFLN